MNLLKLAPVFRRHAVIWKAGRVVALITNESPHVASVLAQQTRGIVFGMTLDENQLTTVFASTVGAGVHGGYGVADSTVAGLLRRTAGGQAGPVSTGPCSAG